MSTSTMPARPAAWQEACILLHGLEERDDGPGKSYCRWHLTGWPVGIVYAHGMPRPWGVYWGASQHVESMAWLTHLSDALELLNCLSRVL